MSDYKIDATNPDNLSKKILPENTTRQRILNQAKLWGCEKDVLKLFNKYDTLLRNCTNEQERKNISELGVLEVYKLFGKGGKLYVNHKCVYDDTPNDNENLIKLV